MGERKKVEGHARRRRFPENPRSLRTFWRKLPPGAPNRTSGREILDQGTTGGKAFGLRNKNGNSRKSQHLQKLTQSRIGGEYREKREKAPGGSLGFLETERIHRILDTAVNSSHDARGEKESVKSMGN